MEEEIPTAVEFSFLCYSKYQQLGSTNSHYVKIVLAYYLNVSSTMYLINVIYEHF